MEYERDENKVNYMNELDYVASTYGGLRPYNKLAEDDYIRIGSAYIKYYPNEFISKLLNNPNFLSDVILSINSINLGEDKSEICFELQSTYNQFLINYVRNSRDIEEDYDSLLEEIKSVCARYKGVDEE